jgi:hypothetical protein
MKKNFDKTKLQQLKKKKKETKTVNYSMKKGKAK